MDYFKGKVVAITGGTSGIGKALVEKLLLSGAKVSTCGRNHDKINNLRLSYLKFPFNINFYELSTENGCQKFIADTIDYFGSIDILINNAGITDRILFESNEMNDFKTIIDNNFMSTVYCTKFSLEEIKKQLGTIVNITSVLGLIGAPGRSAYAASKFAITGFTESLAHEMLASKVHVMWIAPGYIKSDIRNKKSFKDPLQNQEPSNLNEDKMLTVEECADEILLSIQAKKINKIIGGQGNWIYRIKRWFPKIAFKLVHKFYIKNGKLIK
ncbi:MAG: SDR family NAD(P)-dependent oxidoreductase [Sediminibacterium sp.]|nr:SDR family NAD(P)-dependent oxidoreductase [Sediminibacterium sp.]